MRQVGISLITTADICISCGACTHACPHGNLYMHFNTSRGKWEPKRANDLLCGKCTHIESCLRVCPKYDTDYTSLSNSHKNKLLGNIQSVFIGYSKDNKSRYASSSGGFIRALSISATQCGMVDGIIALRHLSGLDYIPDFISNIGDMPNSIYHNINYSNALSILKRAKGKYLIIGLPCQITSICKFMNLHVGANLRGKVSGFISLFCGFTFERINFDALAQFNEINMNTIEYRTGGRYRKFIITDPNGDKKCIPGRIFNRRVEKLNASLVFDNFLCQKGCLLCVDHLGYNADISVGDAWIRRCENDTIGTNIIVVRTSRGKEILSNINEFHFEQATMNELIESQGLYALGNIGEGARALFKREFLPVYTRSKNIMDVRPYYFTLRDRFKIFVIKYCLRKHWFNLARIFYACVEWKSMKLKSATKCQ